MVAQTSAGGLPNFLLIGAMKAGTTSLYHYLRSHPQVGMPKYKAPEFFVEESNWHRGVEWYRRQFVSLGPDVVAVGEASNIYTKYPNFQGIPERIANHIPRARLVYIVRDPIARIRSHYQTKTAEGAEQAPFDEAVFATPAYINYSRYALQIEQYLKFFDREQLLIITSEDLSDARQATIRRVYEFLGVDADFLPADLNRNFYQTKDRAVRSPIPLWLRKGLKKYFPATKRFKEMENNTMRAINRLRRRTKKDPGPAKSFVIPDAVREKLALELEDDVRRLRSYMGPDFDGWGIA